MQITKESRRAWWAVMLTSWVLCALLAGLHAKMARDHLALLDRVGLRGAPAAPTPMRHAGYMMFADVQTWVRYGLGITASPSAPQHFTDSDNAPWGREVHWNSTFARMIVSAGSLRHAFTEEPLPLAIENSLVWINLPLLLGFMVLFSSWVGRRAGAGAGLLVAFGMVGHLDFYAGFFPGYVDHHGLLTASVFGLVLGALFMGGGWWRTAESGTCQLLPASRESARNAAVFSALCGAFGCWISAASLLPAIALLGVAGVLAAWWHGRVVAGEGAQFDPDVWRWWGRVGAGASGFFYLLEYAPAVPAMRLEVNHPLYALAWWGGSELVAQLAEMRVAAAGPTRGFRWTTALAVLAVAAAPLAIVVGGVRVFVLRDPFIMHFARYVAEGQSLQSFVQSDPGGLKYLAPHLHFTALPVVVALAMLLQRRHPQRILLGFGTIIALGLIGLAFWQVRWTLNASAPQLALLLVVLALLMREWTAVERWILVLATALVMFLPGSIVRIVEGRKISREPAFSWIDLRQPLYRDVAAALRSAQPTGTIVLLTDPDASVAVGYYGQFKTIGTLYWENLAGMKAAAAIFSAQTHEEAGRLIRERGITHIALIATGNFLREYFELHGGVKSGATYEKSFGFQLATKQPLPPWLEVIPYQPPRDLKWWSGHVLLFKVVSPR